MSVTCDLLAEKRGTMEWFINIGKFNLGEYKAFILAVKLIDLNRVFAVVYEIACFLYTSGTA